MNRPDVAIRWGLMLALFIALPFFFVGGPDWQAPPLYRQVWNGGHIAFFGLFIILVQQFISLASPLRWLYATVLVLVVGAMIEVIQQYVGREFSYQDLFFDVMGLWLGLSWGQKPSLIIWIIRLATCLLLTPFLWGVIQASQLQLNSERGFPTLSGFEYDAELLRVSGPANLSRELKSQGERSLRIDFNTGKYSTVSINSPLGNWQDYRLLTMDIYNPDASSLRLVIRISDKTHDRGTQALTDRFNKALNLASGWNNIELPLDDIRRAPLNRVLDLAQITNISFFSQNLENSRTVYLDNIRLEK